MPFETYAALLNLKKVLPSVKTNFIAVDKDFWLSVFSVKVSEVDVDEDWYMNKYPDIREAFRSGLVGSAGEHYSRFGYFEHRMPYYIEVNSNWYASEYPDVGDAINNKIFASAQDHFEQIGYQEGRHPYAGFALRKHNEDVSPIKKQSYVKA